MSARTVVAGLGLLMLSPLAPATLGANDLDTDVEIDDFPVVETPRLASGLIQRFQVEISLFECSPNPCRYAVAVFAN